jgi:transcription elongation GreA/GreB family factor
MLTSQNKKIILDEALQLLNEKITNLNTDLIDLSAGLQNDTKSSAGDKHETARAMNQLEQEKLQHQLAEFLRQKEMLTQTEITTNSSVITSGSLFQTNNGLFFLSIPLGRVPTTVGQIMIISPQSPLGKAFLGKRKGDTVEYNTSTYMVSDII